MVHENHNFSPHFCQRSSIKFMFEFYGGEILPFCLAFFEFFCWNVMFVFFHLVFPSYIPDFKSIVLVFVTNFVQFSSTLHIAWPFEIAKFNKWSKWVQWVTLAKDISDSTGNFWKFKSKFKWFFWFKSNVPVGVRNVRILIFSCLLESKESCKSGSIWVYFGNIGLSSGFTFIPKADFWKSYFCCVFSRTFIMLCLFVFIKSFNSGTNFASLNFAFLFLWGVWLSWFLFIA